MTATRADLTRGVLLYEQLAAAARERAGALRAQLAEQAMAEYTAQGMAPTWRMPDVGTVVLPVSSQQVIVADEDKLIAYLAFRTPEAVESILRVNPHHLVRILNSAVAAGDVACDPQTGETIPGLAVRAGGEAGTLTFRPSADAKTVARMHAAAMLDRFTADLDGES